MLKKTFISIAILFVALFFSGLYTVDYNEFVVVTEFGKIVNVIGKPGLSVKIPFISSITRITRKFRLFDVPPSNVITKDKKSMIVDNYIIWKVADPSKFIQTIGAIESRALERIEAIVYNSVKNTISAMDQDEIISARGGALSEKITADANRDTVRYGIEIVQAEVKMLDLPTDNKAAVYERMISERNNIAAAYTAEGKAEALKIKNATNREVQIMIAGAKRSADVLIAEGEAKFMEVLSGAYDTNEKVEFYSYLRGLDALKKSLIGETKTVLIDKDSEIAKLLIGK